MYVPLWVLIPLAVVALLFFLAALHPMLSGLSNWLYDRRHNR